MTTSAQLSERRSTSGDTALRVLAGLALLAPALLACLASLVLPTLRTFSLSLTSATLPTQAGRFVGLVNYTRLFQDKALSTALGLTLLMLIIRLAVVAVVPPLLALVLSRFSPVVRIPVRLLFTIPLALFAPALMALTWSTLLNPASGLGVLRGLSLSNPLSARTTFLLVDALSTLALACGVGLVVYLAAVRQGGGRISRRPLLAAGVVGLLAVAALTLQSFTLSDVLTAGGPANSTTTLAFLQYSQAFRAFRMGSAAALAGVTLLVLSLLGLAAGILVAWMGLRLQLEPVRIEQQPGGPVRSPLVTLGLALVLVLGLAVALAGLFGLLWNVANSLKSAADMARPGPLWPAHPTSAAYTELLRRIPAGRVFVNTLLPSLLVVLLVQVPLAYAGGLGIGALRPLGRHSEWLLVLFSPWLFAGIAPLSIAFWLNVQSAHSLNTLPALAPPIWLSVPMLFVLTLFFKGQEPRWRAARAEGKSGLGTFFSHLIWPSLPLVVLLATVALLAATQDLLWPLVVSTQPQTMTAPVALVQIRGTLSLPGPVLAAGLTLFELPAFVFFFLVLGLLQALYLDRLALRTNASPDHDSLETR